MDEQLAYDGCEDELSSVVNEKFLIGSLLADDDSYSPTKEVRNVQRSTTTSSNPFNSHWPENYYQPAFDSSDWNLIPNTQNGLDWSVKPSTNSQSPLNSYSDSGDSFRYNPLSLNLHPYHVQPPAPKPTATVLPFQTIHDRSDEAHSPISDERVSDSGTISPDTRPKTIKWKKVDLSSIDNTQKPEAVVRQNSEISQQNGKSYSSVTQGQHKRLSATSSVPLSKSGNQKNTNVNKKGANNRASRPTNLAPGGAPSKPSKIVGLNPINTNTPRVSELQKTPVQTPVSAIPTAVPDFQKIKRKKKGKANAKIVDPKQSEEQKAGSRYLALTQSDFTNGDDFLLENAPSDDEDDDLDECEYERKEEEEKEQIRQQARQQFANEKVPEEEANEKMKKLENEIRAIFEKRKTAKQQRISSQQQRHRRRKTGYQLMIPTILNSITSVLGSAIYQSFTFFFNLVANVLVLSYHAFTDSIKTLILNVYQFICSFYVVTVGTILKNCRNFIEQIKLCGAVECQIGLPANAPYPLFCEDVLERIYGCVNADAFSVLGLSKDATLNDIHICFEKCIAVINPVKKRNVGCEDAYRLLEVAYELICTEDRKQAYLEELEQLPQTYALQVRLDEFKNLINTKGAIMHCECGENHAIIRIPNYEGRFCVQCNQPHSIKNGDLWVEKQYFGWVLTYYAVLNGIVYDVTEWGNCAANSLKRPKVNPHMITHRLYNASANATVTNGTEKHRCSARTEPDRGSRSIVLPKETLPYSYFCCCSLLLCPPSDTVILRDIPCCFGGIFVAINTTASPITAAEKLIDNERARKAGRRRKYR